MDLRPLGIFTEKYRRFLKIIFQTMQTKKAFKYRQFFSYCFIFLQKPIASL